LFAAASTGPVLPVLEAVEPPDPPPLAKTATPPIATTADRARAHHHEEVRLALRARATALPRGRVAVAGRFAGAVRVPVDFEPVDGLVPVDAFEPPDESEGRVGRAAALVARGIVLAAPALRFLATVDERTRRPAGS
jgi:hypothetical protein